MSDPRPASRRRRPAFDPRLLLGVGLVLASVAGVTAIVGAADRRVTVYAAAETLAPGETVGAEDLVARQVALDDARSLYLGAGDLAAGLVATAVIRQGELVPRSSVGTEAGSRSTSLVIQVTGDVSEAVTEGASVDVWSTPAVAADTEAIAQPGFGPPIVLVPGATVVRVLADDGFVSASDGRAVEVLVPATRIARVLQAIAAGDALAVVPAGIPLASR
jgi:hypothetical protein